MAKIERTYNVPLRKAFRKSPRYKKSKKAIAELKKFLAKHMKSDNIKIGKVLNEHIWENGVRCPPHHVKITVVKEDDGTVKAELFGFKYREMTKEEVEKLKEPKKKESKKSVEVEEDIASLEEELGKVTGTKKLAKKETVVEAEEVTTEKDTASEEEAKAEKEEPVKKKVVKKKPAAAKAAKKKEE
ncbi:MAG: 50S ribosomal protein L31e [archaeon]